MWGAPILGLKVSQKQLLCLNGTTQTFMPCLILCQPCRDYMDRFLDEQENSQQQQLQQQQQQHHHQDGERSCSPSEPKRPRLAGPLQLTSHLARHENGRDPTSAVSANPAAFPRENGRGDRLWTGPESSSDEDDLPLIATARPPLAKTAPASPAVSNKATSSGTLVASAHTTAPAAPQPATPDE